MHDVRQNVTGSGFHDSAIIISLARECYKYICQMTFPYLRPQSPYTPCRGKTSRTGEVSVGADGPPEPPLGRLVSQHPTPHDTCVGTESRRPL